MQSESIGKLAAALAKAQAAMTPVTKNRQVRVTSRRTGGTYEFAYATLDHIIESVREPLTSNGLWFSQLLGFGPEGYVIHTTLLHDSGEWLASNTVFTQPEADFQSLGSAITYMRRYTLSSMLGIASEEDDDANTADGNRIEKSKDRQPANDNIKVANDNKTAQWTGGQAPAFIPRDGMTAITWCQTFLSAIKQSKDVDAWIQANSDNLRTLEETARPMYLRLMAQVTERIKEIEASWQKTEQGASPHQPPSPDNSAADSLVKLEAAMTAASSKKELNAVYASYEAEIRERGQEFQDAAVQLLLINEKRLAKARAQSS